MAMGTKAGDGVRGMQLDQDSQNTPETHVSSTDPIPDATLDFTKPLQQIADLLGHPDFPRCALGEFVDCGGFSGIVVQIVKQSVKVRSQEGATRSYNIHGLRKLYGPRTELAPLPEAAAEESAPLPPPRVVVAEPDFNQPVTAIAAYVADPNFPKCTFGKLIDFGGFTGVVVEIVNGSIKVRSIEETTRGYNFKRLRELHAKPA